MRTKPPRIGPSVLRQISFTIHGDVRVVALRSRRADELWTMEKPPPPVKTSFRPRLAPSLRNPACLASCQGASQRRREVVLGGRDRGRWAVRRRPGASGRAVARHLRVLREIPDFLPYLHVDVDAVREGPSTVCDGLGVFATRDLKRSRDRHALPSHERGVAAGGAGRRPRAGVRLAIRDVRRTQTRLRHVQRQYHVGERRPSPRSGPDAAHPARVPRPPRQRRVRASLRRRRHRTRAAVPRRRRTKPTVTRCRSRPGWWPSRRARR